jgi:predicted AAA+ superfamily ATPase
MATVISSAMISANIWHWRTPRKQEVDIVIEHKGRLYAFECKWNPNVQGSDLKGLLAFKNSYGSKVAFMVVVTSYGHQMELSDGIFQIPWFPK